MPPNPTTKSWSAWLDSVLYHADRFMRYRDFISEELKRSDQPSDSLIRLGEIFADELHLLKLQAQFAFIKKKGPTILIYLDFFQMKVPHVTQAHAKMNQLLDYLKQNTALESHDLPSYGLCKYQQDALKSQFERAFTQAEAKLRKYIVDGGQPASEFLKEIKVLEPRNIVLSSKLYGSYDNIPGFKDNISTSEWQKYINTLGPKAVSESLDGKVDLKQFWKSNAIELPGLYKLASCYCTGTLGSYDVERAFSSYNSILDSKRRNLNEQTLRAMHFLNWNLRVKNTNKEESLKPPPPMTTEKASRHLSTKLSKPSTSQEAQEPATSSTRTSSSTPLAQQLSIKDALKHKSKLDSKCCYLCQREVSYGHKCSKCKRIVCTFPACCLIEETLDTVSHTCKACTENVKGKKGPTSSKRKLKSTDKGTGGKKVCRQGRIDEMAGEKTPVDDDNTNKEGTTEDTTLPNLTRGMYVRVQFPAPRAQGPKMFSGIVLRAEQEEIEVRFMKEMRAGDKTSYFVWPEIDDESWITSSDVVEILKYPVMDKRGHYHF